MPSDNEKSKPPIFDGRASISIAMTIVIIGAVYSFTRDTPTNRDLDKSHDNSEAMSLRITSWAKEEFKAQDARNALTEVRLQSQIDRHIGVEAEVNRQIISRLDILDSDIKQILGRLPRRIAEEGFGPCLPRFSAVKEGAGGT